MYEDSDDSKVAVGWLETELSYLTVHQYNFIFYLLQSKRVTSSTLTSHTWST